MSISPAQPERPPPTPLPKNSPPPPVHGGSLARPTESPRHRRARDQSAPALHPAPIPPPWRRRQSASPVARAIPQSLSPHQPTISRPTRDPPPTPISRQPSIPAQPYSAPEPSSPAGLEIARPATPAAQPATARRSFPPRPSRSPPPEIPAAGKTNSRKTPAFPANGAARAPPSPSRRKFSPTMATLHPPAMPRHSWR